MPSYRGLAARGRTGRRAHRPLAPSRADACNPLLQAHPTWARDKHEGRGFPLLRLSPPFALRLAPTHLGWGTRANCRCFDPGGSLDRRVNCRRVPQPRWVGARRSTKGGRSRREAGVRGEIPRPSCLSRAQVGCACSRGLQASTREGASGLTRAPSRPSPRGPTLVRGP